MALSAQTVENSKLLLLRGDATETVRITDCLLKSFSDQKVHAQHTLARTDLLCMLNWGTQWTMVSYLKK